MMPSSGACTHEFLFGNLCTECGADLGHRFARRAEDERAEVRAMHSRDDVWVRRDVAVRNAEEEYKALMRQGRLVLIMDIDHTMLHAHPVRRVRTHAKTAKNHPPQCGTAGRLHPTQPTATGEDSRTKRPRDEACNPPTERSPKRGTVQTPPALGDDGPNAKRARADGGPKGTPDSAAGKTPGQAAGGSLRKSNGDSNFAGAAGAAAPVFGKPTPRSTAKPASVCAEEAPAYKDQVCKEQAPVDKDQTPVDKDQVCKDQASVCKDQTPVDKDQVCKEQAPVDKDQTPVDKDQVCKDQASVCKDQTPVDKDQVCKDQASVCKDQASVYKDQASVYKDQASAVHSPPPLHHQPAAAPAAAVKQPRRVAALRKKPAEQADGGRLPKAAGSGSAPSIPDGREAGRMESSVHEIVAHRVVHAVKLRPGLFRFLRTVAPLFELHVFTHGTREYAAAVLEIIDPTRSLFADRVVSRCDIEPGHRKSLARIFPHTSDHVVIVDDIPGMWNDRSSVLRISPFFHFIDPNAPEPPPATQAPAQPRAGPAAGILGGSALRPQAAASGGEGGAKGAGWAANLRSQPHVGQQRGGGFAGVSSVPASCEQAAVDDDKDGAKGADWAAKLRSQSDAGQQRGGGSAGVSSVPASREQAAVGDDGHGAKGADWAAKLRSHSDAGPAAWRMLQRGGPIGVSSVPAKAAVGDDEGGVQGSNLVGIFSGNAVTSKVAGDSTLGRGCDNAGSQESDTDLVAQLLQGTPEDGAAANASQGGLARPAMGSKITEQPTSGRGCDAEEKSQRSDTDLIAQLLQGTSENGAAAYASQGGLARPATGSKITEQPTLGRGCDAEEKSQRSDTDLIAQLLQGTSENAAAANASQGGPARPATGSKITGEPVLGRGCDAEEKSEGSDTDLIAQLLQGTPENGAAANAPQGGPATGSKITGEPVLGRGCDALAAGGGPRGGDDALAKVAAVLVRLHAEFFASGRRRSAAEVLSDLKRKRPPGGAPSAKRVRIAG
ncbi:RNA polymerase II subunit A C-terminal domain phosphatase [Diplonema papillatum]|nr:RNA polymerase II subunit A C-terminal domain phosphatase [Diplonema papillatum]